MCILDALLLLTQVQIEPKMSNQVQKGGSRKTRTDTHHSRALDSLLDFANLHAAVFV